MEFDKPGSKDMEYKKKERLFSFPLNAGSWQAFYFLFYIIYEFD